MAVRIDNLTVVAATGSTATISGNTDAVIVTNVDGAGIVSFRVDGVAASDQADENFVIPAQKGESKRVQVPRGWSGTVHLDASADTVVSVEAIDR